MTLIVEPFISQLQLDAALFLRQWEPGRIYSPWKFKRAPKTWFSYLSYSETFLECINDRSCAFSFRHLKFLVGRKVLQRRESQLASGLVCSKTKYGFYALAAKKTRLSEPVWDRLFSATFRDLFVTTTTLTTFPLRRP